MPKLMKSCSDRRRSRAERELPKTLQLRFEVISALNDFEYWFENQCPKCGYLLNFLEVCGGFSKSSNNLNTGCPSCGKRFRPRLAWRQIWGITVGGWFEESLLSPAVVKSCLRGLEMGTLDDIRKYHSTLYHSAIVHNGTLSNAFREAGSSRHVLGEFSGLREKAQRIQRFFGKLSDSEIARLSGLSTATVRSLRKKAGIKPYNVHKTPK